MKRSILICAILLLGYAICFGQNTISGKVTSKIDGRPIAGATVQIRGKVSLSVFTDIEGKFIINVPSSSKSIEVSATGFISKMQTIDQIGTINFEMTPNDGTVETTGSGANESESSTPAVTGKIKLVKKSTSIRPVSTGVLKISSKEEDKTK